MLKRVLAGAAVAVMLAGAAMSQESDGAGTYTLQSLIREADSGSVAGYGYRTRTFLVYSSDCDDDIAEECGYVSFACSEYGPTIYRSADSSISRVTLNVSFLSVEAYELAAMLQTAASLLPDSYAKNSDSQPVGLPRDAFRVLTDKSELEVQQVEELRMNYDFQFGLWAVTIVPDVADLTAIMNGASWLRLSILGQEGSIDDGDILKSLHQFISSCPE